MVRELRDTTKSTEKVAIVRKYPELYNFLHFFLNCGPLNVTSRLVLKHEETLNKTKDTFGTIEGLMTALCERKVSGHDAISAVLAFIKSHQDYRDLLLAIIDKELKVGMGPALFRKALQPPASNEPVLVDSTPDNARHVVLTLQSSRKTYPVTSKELPIALGYPLQHPSVKLKATEDYWLISRKLDGIRCLAYYDGKHVTMYTRAGNVLHHLPEVSADLLILAERLKSAYPESTNFYIDGELCILGSGLSDQAKLKDMDRLTDDFRSALSVVLSKPSESGRVDRKRLVFFAFDLIDLSIPDLLLSERLARLKAVHTTNSNTVWILPQYRTQDPFDFRRILNDVERTKHWEGLILRKDAPFVSKRTKDIIKIKDFFEAEFPVTGHRLERMQVTNNGRHEEEELLAAVKIDFGGTKVWVGSGFSLEERRQLAKNPGLLDDAQVTVRYFQESSSLKRGDGKSSLRFPTVKAIFTGPRTV